MCGRTLLHRTALLMQISLFGMLLVACRQEYEIARADVERDTAPDVSEAELEELAAGNRAFAFDLYQAVREGQEGNFVFSPYSISRTLAMVYAGARGETEQEMGGVLHFTLPQERLHPAFDAIDLELISRGNIGPYRDVVSLSPANAVWAQSGGEFRADYLDTLARYYDTGVYLADFAGAPEDARELLNGWMSGETTGERVAEQFPAGAITPDTSLVLTSAITFDATWYAVFLEDNTDTGSFFLIDGSMVNDSQMRRIGGDSLGLQCSTYEDAEGEIAVYAIEVVYRNENLGMMVLLPQSISFAQLEDALDPDLFSALWDGQTNCGYLPFFMPRFEVGSEIDLEALLSEMGMQQAFLPGEADFSGMVDAAGEVDSLHLDIVEHAPFIEVYEGGTATAPIDNPPEREIVLPVDEDRLITVNQPFVFVIYDRPTGTILFMGRVVDPR